MPQKGSNDLNMLLKAKVVKLRAELDVKSSMTKIKAQVDEISKLLEKKPVKLKVQLHAPVSDINKQIKTISNTIQNSKSFKPLRINVEIDVKGSAEKIKKQLKEVMDVVKDFNQRYGKQLKEMQQAQLKAQQVATKAGSVNIPTGAGVQNFNNIKNYVNQLSEAERQLRSKFGDGKGLFSSLQLKDAQGNLRGFVASLERANGVVEKIRYDWNKNKNQFQVVDRQTATNTEKMVHKASQSLADLQRELGKTGQASRELTKEYKALEKAGANGSLTNDMVKAYQTKVKNAIEEMRVQKELNALKREEAKLVRDIANATKGTRGHFKTEVADLMSQAKKAKNMDAMKDVRTELGRLQDQVTRYNDKIKEANQVDKQRESAVRQLNRYLRETHETNGALAQDNIRAVQQLAKRASTTRQMAEVQKQLNSMYRQQATIKDRDDREKALQKLQKTMMEFAKVAGTSGTTINQRFEDIKKNAKNNLAQIESEISKWNKKIAQQQNKINTTIANGYSNTVVTNASKGKMKSLIASGDITAIKDYLSQVEKLNIATAKMSTNSRGVTKITTTLESTGKTAKQVTYEVDALNGALRRVGQSEVFNRNANLGIFEQLRIAMERVPIWMTAMTAFYGSINVVKSMTSEILQLDKALTELRRVASDSISIDTMFEGGVALSKELGNNVHDIMNGISELARTFGDFNERQLLAITKTATLMSNVSDLNAEEATNSLVGTMNAFSKTAEQSIEIVDAFNEVDNNFAISTKQLAEGMAKGASTARTFGVSMEESIGHITAIGAVTMESGKIIGNSLKTVYSRITTIEGAKAALEDVGVAITDQKGDVLEVQDILESLSGRWNKISDAQRQNIAVQVAGRYQLSRFLALMNNWEMASKATETAMHSEGSAMRENARYMQSFEARINQLKNSWTELSSAVGDSVLTSSLLMAINSLTKLAGVAITVTDTIGALPVVFTTLFLVMNKMKVFDSFKLKFGSAMDSVHNAWRSAGDSAGQGATRMQRAGAVATASFRGVQTRARTMATSVSTSFKGMILAMKTFSTEAKLALASTFVGGAFVALGFAIEWLMKKYQEKKKAEEELIKLNKKMVDGYRSHRDGMDSMVSRYEELTNKTRLTKDEQEELSQIQSDFAKQIPTTVEYVDANGKAHMKSADAIKAEIEQVKQLSKEQANLDIAKYNEKLEKQATNYGKILDKVAKLKEDTKELQAEDGTTRVNTYGYGNNYMTTETVDNTKEIQENKVAVLMAEAEKTEALKKTVKQISDQTRSWLEANNMMSNISDEQLASVENFINYNEAILRSVPDEAEFKKAYEGLFAVGTQIGQVFSDAYDKLSKTIKDDDPLKDMKLEDLRKELDGVAKAIPESFYSLTDAQGNVVKSSDDVVNGIKEIINVTNLVGTSSVDNTDTLIYRLQRAGFSAEDAQGYLYRLANEENNLAIKAELASRGIDETTGSIESLSEETMEAIDLTSKLFGYSGTELEGIKSHIQAMELLVDTQGKGAKSSQEYIESQEAVSNFLGITADELEDNKNKYFQIIEAISKLQLSEYTTGTDWKKFVEDAELTPDQEKILLGWDGTKDIITGAVRKTAEEVKPATEEIKTAVEDVFDDVQLKLPEIDMTSVKGSKYYVETEVNNMKGTIETLMSYLGEFDIKLNTPTGVAIFDELMNDLTVTDGKIDETDTNIYILRTALSTAVSNPALLEGINLGLDTTKGKADTAKGALDGVKSTVELPTSPSPFLNPVNQGLDDTKAKADEVNEAWSVTSSVFKTPVSPSFDLNGLNNGLGLIQQTKDTAKQAETSTKDVVSAGSQVSVINQDLTIVSDQSDKTKDKIGKLNSALKGLGEKFSTGFIRDEIHKIGTKLDAVKTKATGFSTTLANAGNVPMGGLPVLISQLGMLNTSLKNAETYGKATANAQVALVQAFSNVVNVTKAYNSAIANAGTSMGATYMALAQTIVNATQLMINQYIRHASAIALMVSVVDKALKEMVHDFDRATDSATQKVDTMTSKMHRAFKDGMNDIVDVASGVPARIGQAIRDNMAEASGVMDEVAQDMVKRFKSELGIHSPSRVFEDLGYWTIKGLANGLGGEDLKSLGKSVFDDFGGGVYDSWDMIKAYVSGDWSSIAGGAGGAGVQQWAGLASKALEMTGQMSKGNLQALLMQMQSESGGNAGAINLWDSNAMRGTPSKGLMQVIDPTFRAYAMKGYDKNVFDPLSNMIASIRYAVSRYGSLQNAYRGVGYEEGGLITEQHLAMVGEGNKREMVIPLEQHRNRALGLWEQAGEYLGISPRLIDVLKANLQRGKGGMASSGGGAFGASSGEGGGEGGGGGTGTSGIMSESIYAGLRNTDASYTITALASNDYKYEQEMPDAFKYDKYERTLNAYEAEISKIEAKMNGLNEATKSYRESLKSVLALQNKSLSVEKQQLSATEKRNKAITKELSKLPAVSKQTVKQREKYNELMEEYDSNLTKINSLKTSIESSIVEIRQKSIEIFTDFIGEIVNKYESAFTKIENKVDDLDFSLDVAQATEPDNIDKILNLQAEKAKQIQKQQATAYNKVNDLEYEYNKVSKSKGSSSAEAKAVKEQLDEAREQYEDYKLAVIQAEQDIRDSRADVADSGIDALKDYYDSMKDMATKAIDLQKEKNQEAFDKEMENLEELHNAKMESYDKEIEKITSVYDEQSKQFDKNKSEEEFLEGLNEKNTKKAELVNKISILSRDTSLEGRKKVAELQAELKDLNKEIADYQQDRQDELYKTALEEQKEQQLKLIEDAKTKEDESYTSTTEKKQADFDATQAKLDEESEAITKKYDDLLNNDKYWADMRTKYIEGSFGQLNTQLSLMQKNLELMDKGVFTNLTDSFGSFAQSVKDEIAEMNSLAIDNAIYNNKETIDNAKETAKTSYKYTEGYLQKNAGTNVDVKAINNTSTKSTSSKSSSSTSKSSTSTKKSTTSTAKKTTSTTDSADRKTTTALNFRKSPAYGNNVISTIPKDAKVDYVGMEKGWAKIKYKGKTGYVGASYLKKFDTGGYTGDWAGREGKVAMLHKKELVLNERQTEDILDTAKIMDKVTNILPDVKRNTVASKLATAGSITNISYGDINVTVENGDKKKADAIAGEILKGMKKKGR